MKNSKAQRAKRLAVINYSRAGIPYIKYIDSLKASIPQGFMPDVKMSEKPGFIPKRVLSGRSFSRGHFLPKPYNIIGTNPKTGKEFIQTIYPRGK